jgi:hypothetical protein
MDGKKAREIWDQYVNQDPQEYASLSNGYRALQDEPSIGRQNALDIDIEDYIQDLDLTFNERGLRAKVGPMLHEAMEVVLSPIYRQGEASIKAILNGREVYYNAAENMMDDELREEIHREMAPCKAQEFLDEYVKRHEARFKERFDI